MIIHRIKTDWPEGSPFHLERYVGNEFIFIHLTTHAAATGKGVLRDFPAGTCILYPPNAHQILHAYPDGLIHDWMHISSDAAEVLSSFGIQPDTACFLSEDRFVTQLMREMELEMLNHRNDSEVLCDLLLRELFLKIARSLRSDSTEAVAPSVRHAFTELRARIHLHYEKDWTVEEMAALVHLCPSRFFNVYKNIFGISPKNDLLCNRLEHAKQFLCDDTRTVSEIAASVGYANVYHFIRAFKKYTGYTPGQYRIQHAEKV
mgnify:FL=1